jgi:hypothetical protein
MAELVLAWVALVVVCLLMLQKAKYRGTLVLAYILGLSLIHIPGAINFLGEYPRLLGELETRAGLEVTLYGIGAFLAGVGIAWRFDRRGPRAKPDTSAPIDFHRIGVVLFAVGVLSYFFVAPIASFIPSATSILSSIASLIIVGYWAIIYDAAMRADRKTMLPVIATIPLLPLSTLATGGFIGYGVYWMIAILSFFYTILPRMRLRLVIIAPLAGYLGLSLAVAYFSEREAIRDAVWQQQAGYGERFDRISRIVDSFEPYDWNNPRHIEAIDSRLNQNRFVGLGVLRHEMGAVELLHGSSMPWWSLVPRAFWPDKPGVGGGGEVVANFTGVTFAQGTSVGAGQPLEFYANFGWPGLFGCYLLFGLLLGRLDSGLTEAFRTGDVRGLLVNGLPGLALLQPGGNMLEIMVAAVAAAVAARLAFFGLRNFGFVPAVPLPQFAEAPGS